MRAKTTSDRKETNSPTETDCTIISMEVNGDGVADSQITSLGRSLSAKAISSSEDREGGPRD